MDLNYYLFGDMCDSCIFIKNALTLLNLTLIHNQEDILESSASSRKTITFVCRHQLEHLQSFRKKHAKIIDPKLTILLQSSADTVRYLPNNICKVLNLPCNIFDLGLLLSQCKKEIEQTYTPELHHACFKNFLGNSKAATKIKLLIQQVASCDATVLILGESGTGKEIIADLIHKLSPRKNNPFVPINCGAIPSELMESELFGHEKGAFTGAVSRKLGRFELANNGTLFLDEVGDMPLPMQVKLLRVIQDKKIERIGSSTRIETDVRLIAATNKNLDDLIYQELFREDLYYRLNVFPIKVPNLAERSEDIPLIIEHYLHKIFQRLKHSIIFTDDAIEKIKSYSWPGNIRELQNFLERIVITHPDETIDHHHIDLPKPPQKRIKSAFKKDLKTMA